LPKNIAPPEKTSLRRSHIKLDVTRRATLFIFSGNHPEIYAEYDINIMLNIGKRNLHCLN